jgi:hypothetical protein
MFSHIFDVYAQVATALIEIQRSSLEYRFVLAAIEIMKRNKIVQKLVEIPVIADKPVHSGNSSCF